MQQDLLQFQTRTVDQNKLNSSRAITLIEESIESLQSSDGSKHEQVIEKLTQAKKMVRELCESLQEGVLSAMIIRSKMTNLSAKLEKLDETNEELKRTREDLSRTKNELVTTQDDLDVTRKKLSRTEEKLTETIHELDRTNDQLRRAIRETEDHKKKLEDVHRENFKLKEEQENIKKEMEKLKDKVREMENLRERVEEADIRFAQLNGQFIQMNAKSDQVKDGQILGDFAYQIQKVLGRIFKQKKDLTGSQLRTLYKYADLEMKQKLKVLGLQTEKSIDEFTDALEKIKQVRFESAHYGLSTKLPCSLARINSIAHLLHFEDETNLLVNVWKTAVIKGEIFNESSWELDDNLQ